MFQKHRTKIIAGIVVLIVVILFIRLNRSNQQALTFTLEKGTILESVYGIGTVTARRSFQLKSGVPSTIRKLFVKEGDPVKKGDRLIDLESTSVFVAPFDGTVTWLGLKERETAFAGSLLLTLVDLYDRYITVTLEQRAALRVKAGQKARVSFDSLRSEFFEGTVESVYSNENNFLVRILVTDLPNNILPGMTGDVAIAINEKPNVILIPVAGIENGMVQLENGSVAIKTGIVDGKYAELVEGNLKEGDKILLGRKGKK